MITVEDILGAKILIADDCERNTTSLAQILRLEGYGNVSTCNDPRDIVSLETDHRYDLIVLDMHMPYVHGLDLMRTLAQSGNYPFLPVLALSGDASQKHDALGAGARDFLLKPYDVQELKMRIRNTLEVGLMYETLARYSRLQAELALHDVLTGLPNRRLLGERSLAAIHHARRHGLKVALMYIDLDGFKKINDTYGHRFGDKLLEEGTARLRSVTRTEDTLARIGGDEFVLLMGRMQDRGVVLRTAHNILETIARPLVIEGTEVALTASIGIAFFPDHGEEMESILASADQALYAVKHGGKNAVLCAPERLCGA